MRKRFAVSAVLFLCGGLVLIPCHTAMGQCAVLNKLSDLADSKFGEVSQPWKIYPLGERVEIFEWYTRFPHTYIQPQFPHTIGVYHDVHQTVSLEAKEYELTADVRTSPNMRDAWLGFRGGGLPKDRKTQFGPQTDFKTVRIKFTPAQAGSYEVFIGFWARDKEASINVKGVRLLETTPGGCPDSIPPRPPQAKSQQPPSENFRS